MKRALHWNTKAGTHGGFVTRFVVDDVYVSRFERQVVGSREHEELWVPAEELAEFNSRIEGRIEVGLESARHLLDSALGMPDEGNQRWIQTVGLARRTQSRLIEGDGGARIGVPHAPVRL